MSKLKCDLNFKEQQTVFILESVYRNAKLAYEATNAVMEHCRSNGLYKELSKEQRRYKQVFARAREELSKLGAAAFEVSPAVRSMVRTGIMMKAAVKNKTGDLAELMFKGTVMGIIDIQRAINRSRTAHSNIIISAERLLEREQQFCDRLRGFL